jgi:glutamate-1-semialdehyde 2,1-aminomutase
VELAEVLCERIPSVERVRFTNSGTEACLYALRTARAYTGRDAIIKAEGGYHGGTEFLQISVKHLGSPGESVPEAGVPVEAARGTRTIPWNDTDAAVEAVRRVGDRAAALILEPMQGSAGQLPAKPGFLQVLRDVTTETGCLLVFDEVMTLRLGYGGAQERYGVTPDLTTMGKIIGGGFPIGAFGGSAEIMEILDPRRADGMGHHGTFNANPVSLAAGLLTLEDLPRPRVDELNERGDRLRAWINERAAAHELPLAATGDGSLVQVHVGATPPRSFREAAERPRLPLEYLFFSLLDKGVYVAPRGLICLSTALGDPELRDVERALDEALGELGGTDPATWDEVGRPIEDTEGGR